MGEVIQMRDFKIRQEREIEIDRLGMAIVNEALWPTEQVDASDQPDEYTAPDGDCA